MDKTEYERAGATDIAATSPTHGSAEHPWADPGHAGLSRSPPAPAPESDHPAYETVRLLRRLMAEVAPARPEPAALPPARSDSRGSAQEAAPGAAQAAAAVPDLAALERRMKSLCSRLAALERGASPQPMPAEPAALVPLQVLAGALVAEVDRLRQPAASAETARPPSAPAATPSPSRVPAPALLSAAGPAAPEAPLLPPAPRRAGVGVWIALWVIALALGAVALDRMVRRSPPDAGGPPHPVAPVSAPSLRRLPAAPPTRSGLPLPAPEETGHAGPAPAKPLPGSTPPATLSAAAGGSGPAAPAAPQPIASPPPVAASPGGARPWPVPQLPAIVSPTAPNGGAGAGSPAQASAPSQLAASPAPAPDVRVVGRTGPASGSVLPSGPGAASKPPAPTPAALIGSPPARPAAAGATPVMVRAIADTWIQVLNRSGTVVFSRLLHAGDSWTPPGPGLFLTTGNAGGTELVVNGVAGPPLGAAGAVLHQIPLAPAGPTSAPAHAANGG